MHFLKRVCLISLLTPLLLTVPAACQPEPTHDDLLGKPSLTADAGSLTSTVVSPTLDIAPAEGTTVLWCATFQLAWKRLADELGEPLTVSGSAEAIAMSQQIRGFEWDEGNLDAGSYVAHAGTRANGVIKRIRDDLDARFKGAASPSLLRPEGNADEILAYSYLFKHLEFAHPFERLKTPRQFGTTGVLAFGLTDNAKGEAWRKIAGQVQIFDYQNSSHWAIELLTKAQDDRLLLVRAERAPTLAERVERALETFRTRKPVAIEPRDTLWIPIMNFDVTRRFGELSGASVAGTRQAGVIDQAIQNIRFRLDEKGAILKSEVSFGVTSAPPAPSPRQIICDGPFLLLMMRKDAEQPYFVAAVESPELLLPFPAK